MLYTPTNHGIVTRIARVKRAVAYVPRNAASSVLLYQRYALVAAPFTNANNLYAFSNKSVASGPFAQGTLSRIQTELEFSYLPATATNDVLVTAVTVNSFKVGMLFVKPVILNKSLGFQQCKCPIHR